LHSLRALPRTRSALNAALARLRVAAPDACGWLRLRRNWSPPSTPEAPRPRCRSAAPLQSQGFAAALRPDRTLRAHRLPASAPGCRVSGRARRRHCNVEQRSLAPKRLPSGPNGAITNEVIMSHEITGRLSLQRSRRAGKAAALTFAAACTMALGSATAAHASTWDGCPDGAVCVYPEGQDSTDTSVPELVLWSYGAHNLSNMYGL